MMIPHHLIHEHHTALIDAAHQGALLNLESMARVSNRTLANRRRWLDATRTTGEHDLFGTSPLPAARLGTESLDEYRYWMEIAGESYARWIELCESQWRLAHDCVQSAYAYYADRAPAEFGLAMTLAQRANDLATDSAARIAEGSKAAVAEAVGEIASTFPDEADAPAKGKAKRSRKDA